MIGGAANRFLARDHRLRQIFRPAWLNWVARQETSTGVGSFATPMKVERESVTATDVNLMDRQIIQVDMSPAQAGITAALRRAFQAAASEPCDRDFADLLRRLN